MNQPHPRFTTVLRVLAVTQAAAIVTLLALPRDGDEAIEPAPIANAPAAGALVPAVAASAPVSSAPAAAPAPVADANAPVPGGAAPAAAPSSGVVLHGRLTDENGKPITDGSVWFSRDGERAPFATVRVNAQTTAYAIAGVAPGPVTYRTRAAGYKEAAGTIDVAPGAAHHRHDLLLPSAWLLTVKILTPDGTPVSAALADAAKQRQGLQAVQLGAVVTAARPDRDFPPTALREIDFGLGRWRSATGIDARVRGGKQAPKDVAGVVEIDRKQPLWVSAVMRHRVLASVPVEPGQAEVTLTVAFDDVLKQLGTIRGRVVDAATGEPVAKARVGFGDLQSGGAGGLVDAEARFEVTNLRPGLLDVEIMAPPSAALRDLIELQPGQTLDLGDVPVFAFHTIEGRCEGLTGKADACRITCTPLDPPPHRAMRRYAETQPVAADGTFKLRLAPMRYRLRASGAGGTVVDVDVRTPPGAPLVLRLVPEAPLRVDVQSGGEPWELALFDAQNREVYRRDLRDGWKLALSFPLGQYRAELRDGAGKVHTRAIALGESGADLRVP